MQSKALIDRIRLVIAGQQIDNQGTQSSYIDSKYSVLASRKRMLIWVFAIRTRYSVELLCNVIALYLRLLFPLYGVYIAISVN